MPARPDLREIRAYLSDEPLRKWSKEVDRIFSTDELTIHDYKPSIRAALYGVRFIYSWKTGGVTSNDSAVAFVEEQDLFKSGMQLMRAALHLRQTNSVPTSLFEQRKRLREIVDLCCGLIER